MLSPSASGSAELHFDIANRVPSLSRRSLLGLLVLAPVLKALPAEALPDRLVTHQGWVLRTSDLERLGLK